MNLQGSNHKNRNVANKKERGRKEGAVKSLLLRVPSDSFPGLSTNEHRICSIVSQFIKISLFIDVGCHFTRSVALYLFFLSSRMFLFYNCNAH